VPTDEQSTEAPTEQKHMSLVFKYTIEFPEVVLPALASFNFLPQMRPGIDGSKVYSMGPRRISLDDAWNIPRKGFYHPIPTHTPEGTIFQAEEAFDETMVLEQDTFDAFFDMAPNVSNITTSYTRDYYHDRWATPELLIPMQRDLRMITAVLDRARRRQRFNQHNGFDPVYPSGQCPKDHLAGDFFSEHSIAMPQV
jgi:hypothetical protein